MPIKYNEFVKRPREELEYTPEQILELQKCTEDILYFIKYVMIVNPDHGEMFFEPYDYQLDLLEKFKSERFNVALCSRQSGKTTVVGVYALWYAMFNRDKVIGIVSNKESSSKMILARIKRMWESLPSWLKPGVTKYAETFVSFDNGTRIIISATSPDAFRGESINILICDEFAFVPSGQAEDFWSANYPTISASKLAKIIVISTPNGMFNIFHRLYSQAEHNLNTFVHTKITWKQVPGRDKEWADEQLKNLGKQKFAQEFNVEFLGSTNTVIDSETLEFLLSNWKEPDAMDLKDRLFIYEQPEDNGLYTMGVDPAKGTGENHSVIQILKIISVKPIKMEQVAMFRHNLTDVYEFSSIIDRLSYFYNNAYIMCENNGEGAAVIQRIWWELENENLINTGAKTKNLGIRANKITKPRAVLLMKKIVEDGSVRLHDRNTIEELASFIEEKNKFFGKDRSDDCVCALYWAIYLLEMDILDEKFEFVKSESDDAWGILTDVEKSEDWSWLYDNKMWD
jgi:hypothetical protein